MTINNLCSLCVKETDNSSLIWKDSMQLCENCYNRYCESTYNRNVMTINSIRKYRRMLEEVFEEMGEDEILETVDTYDMNSASLYKTLKREVTRNEKRN